MERHHFEDRAAGAQEPAAQHGRAGRGARAPGRSLALMERGADAAEAIDRAATARSTTSRSRSTTAA